MFRSLQDAVHKARNGPGSALRQGAKNDEPGELEQKKKKKKKKKNKKKKKKPNDLADKMKSAALRPKDGFKKKNGPRVGAFFFGMCGDRTWAIRRF